jgi:hypothetical protein
MKTVTAEISVNYESEQAVDGEVPIDRAVAAASSENFQFSLTADVADDVPCAPVVEQLLHEMLRRYKHLNARKTN